MKVRCGLSNLLENRMDLVEGRRVGLASHAPAVLPDLTDAVEALLAAGVKLVALFGPEHGFSGEAADAAAVEDRVDTRTGLPVFSLYGETREPTPAMLESLDVLVVDFQDVGVRFYTYLSTLYYLLRATGKAGKPVIVLDRPNPINGEVIEGPLIEPGFESFVGIVPIPVRHGMTMGELALFLNQEYRMNALLTVVAMQGWSRSMWFDDTGLPWVIPSPGMPKLDTATVYPGTCFIEGTNLSEGRGTSLPFEVVGAPWLDGYALAERMNALDLPGVRFRALNFRPTDSKHAGITCQGVQVHVMDRNAYQPVAGGLHLLSQCRITAAGRFEFLQHSWEGLPPQMDLLTGSPRCREYIAAGRQVDKLLSGWKEGQAQFVHQREPYLLYR